MHAEVVLEKYASLACICIATNILSSKAQYSALRADVLTYYWTRILEKECTALYFPSYAWQYNQHFVLKLV